MTTPNQKTPRGFYVELAKRAYVVGRDAARRANDGQGFQLTWEQINTASQAGHIAFAKAVAKEVNRRWGIGS